MYLPIAQIHVSAILIIIIGLTTGFLGSLFGVGSSFILIPTLTFFAIPYNVAIGCATNQMLGTSAGIIIFYWAKKVINLKIAFPTMAGSLIGLIYGSKFLKYLQSTGQIQLATIFIYIFVLGTVAVFMLQESLTTIKEKKLNILKKKEKGLIIQLSDALPLRVKVSETNSASIIIPFFSGMIASTITLISGLSGGFLLIPIFFYILRLPTIDSIATSSINGFFSLFISTFIHAVVTKSIDISLTIVLLIGAAFGSQFGVKSSQKISPEKLRLSLSIIMFLLIANFGLKLFLEPKEIFSIILEQ